VRRFWGGLNDPPFFNNFPICFFFPSFEGRRLKAKKERQIIKQSRNEDNYKIFNACAFSATFYEL